jgi:hypothetical protein
LTRHVRSKHKRAKKIAKIIEGLLADIQKSK